MHTLTAPPGSAQTRPRPPPLPDPLSDAWSQPKSIPTLTVKKTNPHTSKLPTLHLHAPSTHPASGCPALDGYTVYPGTDHPGSNVTRLPGAGLADMAAACNALSSCLSFNWKPDGTWGWLKAASRPTNLSAGTAACYYVKSGSTGSGTTALMCMMRFCRWLPACYFE